MTAVALVLEGPLQAWGTQSRFSQRDTDREPSKSGVLGLVGAALGMPRDDQALLQRLTELEMAVRVDDEGTVLRDFHTAGGGTFRGQKHSVRGMKDPVITQRDYLMDACFVVALAGTDEELVQRLANALQDPHWPLFLGRKSCIPARPVYFAGPVEGDAWSALRDIPWLGRRTPPPEHLRCVVEAKDGSGQPRMDVPLDFARYQRRFVSRNIEERWMALGELPPLEVTDVPEPASA